MPPKRLFVAVELPDVVRAELVRLGTYLPGVRWHPPEKLHLTLAFLGDAVSPEVLARLKETLAAVRAAPFFLGLAGAGSFGRERPRALWIGVDGASRELRALHQAVGDAVRVTGARNVREEFVPHITLAYAGRGTPAEPVGRWVRTHTGFDGGLMRVEGLTLFSSADGVYTPEWTMRWTD